MRRWFLAIWLNLPLTDGLGQSSANLADLNLEQLMDIPVNTVVGASKYQQRVTRAPASVSIVTEDEIAKFAYRNLGEILRSVPGLYVTNDRNYSFLGFRGFAQPSDFNTGVLLLVDGHRINDPLYNLMYVANEAVIDPDAISRVEIIRGPSSSIYGTSAFFGVINVVTKRGGDIDGLKLSAEAGSFGTYRAGLLYGKKFTNGIEAFFSGSYLTTDGQDRLFFPEYAAAGGDGLAVDSDRETAKRWFGRLSAGDLVLTAAFSDRSKVVPTGPFSSVFNSGLARTIDQRGYVDLTYERELTTDFKLLARASYDWYPYRATWPYENATPPPAITLNRDDSEGRWARAELQATWRLHDRHTLVFGAEYQDNLQLRQSNQDDNPPATYLDIDHGSRLYAGYVQGEFLLAKPLLLNAGIRYDHYHSFGGTTNPRLGLIYSPREQTTFKALYGEAFRAPNDYELNFESFNNKKNPNLKPPAIHTYELVYEQYLPPNLRFSATAYQYQIQGLISTVLDPADGKIFYSNTDNVEARGLELQLEGKAGPFTGRASYAWQQGEETGPQLGLTNSPHQLAKLNLTLPFRREKCFASLEVQHTGPVLTPMRVPVDAFTVVNFTLLARELRPGLEVSASVWNLMNTSYLTPASGSTLPEALAQDGRSFRLRVTQKF